VTQIPEGHEGGVRVRWDLIERALLLSDDHLALLFFGEPPATPARHLGEAMAACTEAMDAANRAVPPYTVEARSVEPSPYGPVVRLEDTGGERDRRTWFDALTEHLTSAGWSGVVGPFPMVWSGPARAALDGLARPTAFLAFSLDANPAGGIVARGNGPRWGVAAETTAALCGRLASWTCEVDGQAAVGMGFPRTSVPCSAVEHLIAWCAIHDHSATVDVEASDPPFARNAALGPWGQVVAQAADRSGDWEKRLATITELLLADSATLDLGVVRTSRHHCTSWIDLAEENPPLPFVREAAVRRHRRVRDRLVPDAHGIQVLTDAHLAKAADLSTWDVVDLGNSRHLVRARDLAAWFAGDQPDPEVLEAARRDFGGMIMTPDSLEAAAEQ
jgi:hypothetical protein